MNSSLVALGGVNFFMADVRDGLGPYLGVFRLGAGLLGVAVPGLVARIMAGTGRANAALDVVMTMQGIGAALSMTLGGRKPVLSPA
jgi:hypothetical protein